MNWIQSLVLLASMLAQAQGHGHHHDLGHDHRHLQDGATMRCGTENPSDESRAEMSQAAAAWKEAHGCDASSDCAEAVHQEVSTVIIPLKWHQMLTTSGDGGVSSTVIQATVDALNIQMAPSGFQFLFDINSDITETSNTNWYILDAANDQDAMKAAVRTDLRCDTLHIFQTSAAFFGSFQLFGYATFPNECRNNPSDSGVVIIESALADNENGVR